MKQINFITAILFLFFACSKSDDRETTQNQPPNLPPLETVNDSEDYDFKPIDGRSLINVDLNQSLEGKSVEEIRLLRNAVYARQGYLFNKAEIRGYFSTFSWYDSLMMARWEQEEMTGEPVAINLTDEEEAFIERAKVKENELLQQNFRTQGTVQKVNVNNIVNTFQFNGMSKDFMNKIAQSGFLIAQDNDIQLFHGYEQNDYQQVPNFVTTDLFLQVYHMYFSFLLKKLEQEIFFDKVGFISEALYERAREDYQAHANDEIVKAAKFNTVFFAVAAKLIGKTPSKLPEELKEIVDSEYNKVMGQRDLASEFMGYPDPLVFPYSLFKPRGHYSRNETLQKYFRVMMWLQKGEMCVDDDESFQRAVYMASLVKNTFSEGKSIQTEFLSVYEPIKFIIGEPDNLSIMDAINNMSPIIDGFDPADMEDLKAKLTKLDKNRIGPKGENFMSCKNKINLMPQRYLLDNAVIQDLVDTKTKPESKRPYPKGIDVFGVLGVQEAESLLLDYYNEDQNWEDFIPEYNRLKGEFSGYNEWDNSVYTKWIECLTVMQKDKDKAPYFMQTRDWAKKDLNTGLASWAELKHDAILYAEQPAAAECGGYGPPPPITVGYVEPNIPFWKKMLELIDLTENVLKSNNLIDNEISSKSTQIRELAQFLLQASEKEIKGEKLTNEEYSAIEIIGSTVEYMTISLLDQRVNSWSEVTGPDREVAVVADIYTANAQNNPNKGILHVAVGPVNSIFVVVEIEGYLYLTKGSVFSYHEFAEPMGSRLTDEEWQKRIKDNKTPPIPEWMKEMLFNYEAPEPNEKIFYSSGC